HEDKSQLIADGKTSPVVAVQFFDADGYPLREGTQGSYQIEAPYRSQVSLEELENNPLALSASSNRFIIEREGIAYIKLQPTSKSGEAKLSFTMDNQEVKIVKSWLKPEPRDWILVGFAQGSVGYETLKSNSETSDENSDIYKDGRVAFFAKGKVKGEWILSLAYDSGKKEEKQKLEEEIDPNQYYTLYGDDSEQHYDASSQKKLYVKLEKSNFYALFGNFQTGLTTTELSQYHRAMHGVKSEYHDKYVEGSFFVSKSDQMFQRDEIAGDGTSGFYHLSQKNLIMNSETITLEVRDRYRNEIVVSTEKLRRYQDYEIDYTLGRLYFKKPIYRNDENFNPQYIVVEYELNANAVESYTYGARAVVKPTEKIAIASTYVNEDSGLMQKQLLGFDAEIELGQQTRLRAEYAQTDIKDDNLTQTGSAKYLALEHLVQGVGISAYFREQEGAFGLGQLSTQLGATRKIGVDVHKRFSRWLIESSFYRDEMLNTENFNDVAELNLGYDDGYWGAIIGYRYIKNSVEKGVNQINMMLSRSLFDHKLHLSVSRDQSLGSKKIENYPTRTAVQANYNITSSVEVFGTYEINEVEETSTQTRAGMRVRPWSGATVESSQMSELNTEGSRVYNLLGFQQQLQVVENIGISMGYEQANKVKSTLESEEFEAYNIGANYNSKRVTGNIRAELKQGALEDKKNLQSAVYTQHGDDLALALGGRYVDSKNDSDNNRQVDAKVALAYRAEESKWMILSQLAYLNTLREGSKEYIKTAKLISNTFLNYKPNQQTELLFSYGLKHVLDSFDRTSGDYESYIDFAGLDMSYALSSGFDMGLQGALLHSYSGENMEYSSGIYVGYNLFDNSWLRVGYNLTGFSDDDFSLQNYHRSGIYLQFNMKFDQESLKNSAGSLVW
nr:hypothetical protein [Campylobacterota bacterium]